ncbi:putative beta-glucosidase [Hortaea werneckii]|nr:putative beta-glucosidase [Hortaea werneckii]
MKGVLCRNRHLMLERLQAIEEVTSVVAKHANVLGSLQRKCVVGILEQDRAGRTQLTDEFGMIGSNVHIRRPEFEIVHCIVLCVKFLRILAAINRRVVRLAEIKVRRHDAPAHIVHPINRQRAIVHRSSNVAPEEGMLAASLGKLETTRHVHVEPGFDSWSSRVAHPSESHSKSWNSDSPRDTSLDAVLERPEVKFMHGPIVDIGRQRLDRGPLCFAQACTPADCMPSMVSAKRIPVRRFDRLAVPGCSDGDAGWEHRSIVRLSDVADARAGSTGDEVCFLFQSELWRSLIEKSISPPSYFVLHSVQNLQRCHSEHWRSLEPRAA